MRMQCGTGVNNVLSTKNIPNLGKWVPAKLHKNSNTPFYLLEMTGIKRNIVHPMIRTKSHKNVEKTNHFLYKCQNQNHRKKLSPSPNRDFAAQILNDKNRLLTFCSIVLKNKFRTKKPLETLV